MLTFLGRSRRFCDGASRRDFLRVGALSIGGLTLADLLRYQAHAATPAATLASAHPSSNVNSLASTRRAKSVIMIYLPGGPTHLDTYDLKPAAPLEIRGELSPIATRVPGVEICELMPRQAEIMDKLSIVRGLESVNQHSSHMLMTGFPDKVKRPALGSVVSYLGKQRAGMPAYVSLSYNAMGEDPAYVGAAHRPFVPSGPGLNNLSLVSGVSLERLADRRRLLHDLDTIHRDLDYGGAIAGVDAFTSRAIDMVTSTAARDAFDLEREPRAVRDRYGAENKNFLAARRLVEAGVSVVTLSVGSWDTHTNNFAKMRQQLPQVDRGVHALVTDLAERGMSDDVAVVMWGEFGRTPRINPRAGRDHWPSAGFALLAGGGFRHGQAIGETDARAERSKGRPHTPSHVLATLYRHLGIDPAMQIHDLNGRPVYLLDDREVIHELV